MRFNNIYNGSDVPARLLISLFPENENDAARYMHTSYDMMFIQGLVIDHT